MLRVCVRARAVHVRWLATAPKATAGAAAGPDAPPPPPRSPPAAAQAPPPPPPAEPAKPTKPRRADLSVSLPVVSVLGVGGAGGNAVNNMIEKGIHGVQFVVANTDAQALAKSLAPTRVQLGKLITRGLGAGARPDVGKAAAEEDLDELNEILGDTSVLFITAGLGGGTGTGASPVVAEAARKAGKLTVGVVSTPFVFEGKKRQLIADEGITELQDKVDTLMVVPNQNLLANAKRLTLIDAFKNADDVLYRGVRGITDLVTIPGLVNVDYADIITIMKDGGRAHMGIGEAEGPGRAEDACNMALSNPLLSDCDLHGATGALINVSGHTDLTLVEVDEIARRVQGQLSPDANIIFGSTFDEALVGRVRVTLIVTGLQSEVAQRGRPTPPVGSAAAEPLPQQGNAEKGESVGHQAQPQAEAQAQAQAQATSGPSFMERLRAFLARNW